MFAFGLSKGMYAPSASMSHVMKTHTPLRKKLQKIPTVPTIQNERMSRPISSYLHIICSSPLSIDISIACYVIIFVYCHFLDATSEMECNFVQRHCRNYASSFPSYFPVRRWANASACHFKTTEQEKMTVSHVCMEPTESRSGIKLPAIAYHYELSNDAYGLL